MIYWRVSPDGSRLTIRWLPRHRRWEVKRDASADWFEARQLALALAAATGEPPSSPWIIARVEDEIEEHLDSDLRAAIAEATESDPDEPWLVAICDEIEHELTRRISGHGHPRGVST